MEAIKQLMDLGILVEPDVAEKLKTMDESQINTLIEKAKQERPLVLTDEIVKDLLKKTFFKILQKFEKSKKYTIQDFVDVLNKRYDFIQSLLMRKVELSNIVSINKCSNGKLSIIGMVKNKEQSDGNIVLELEDKTGSVKTIISKDLGDKVCTDDIIAVYGNYNNKLLFGEKIIYPDVPLRKVNNSESDTKVGFIINHDFSEKLDIDPDYLFVGNCDNIEKAKEQYPRAKIFFIDDKKKIEGLYYITNPCMIDIDGIKILILFDHDPLKTIKRRFISIDNNDFLIDPVPDIIFTNKDINTNYKAITIISEKSLIGLSDRSKSPF